MLVENAGRLVTKQQLLDTVWPETTVEENNLNHNVSVLRKALGDRATGQRYIETVPRVGYRCVAPVEGPIAQPTAEVLSPGHSVTSIFAPRFSSWKSPTDNQRWSQRFDRTLDDVFTLQDEIVEAVVAFLRAENLSQRERAALR